MILPWGARGRRYGRFSTQHAAVVAPVGDAGGPNGDKGVLALTGEGVARIAGMPVATGAGYLSLTSGR